jgi:hypothetical protein
MKARQARLTLAVGAVVVLIAAGTLAVMAGPADATTRVSSKTLLSQLTVAAQQTTGYARSKFKLWDEQGGGCNTRDKVLITEATTKPSVSSTCKLTGGKWTSPYDGVVTAKPTTFDIDHLVPLAEAWRSGAGAWTAKTREAYANDLGYAADLIAVSAHANRSKGDDEPSAYLPPKTSFDCTYQAWWVAVKWRWHLAIDRAEKSWLTSHLAACHWPTVTRPLRFNVGSGGGTTPPPTTSGIAISAIYFDSPGADTGTNASVDGEWVQVKNGSTSSRVLTGWTISDASSHKFTFPTYTLTAGKTVKVHSGSGTKTSASLYWRQSSYIWNNGGDTATLRSSTGSTVDACSYTSAVDPEAHC